MRGAGPAVCDDVGGAAGVRLEAEVFFHWRMVSGMKSVRMGTCLCASATSAVTAKVLFPVVDVSRIALLRSAVIGARSWSRLRVLLLTEMPYVPSNRTLAVTRPFVLHERPERSDDKLGESTTCFCV